MLAVLPVLNNHVRKLARREIRTQTTMLRRNSAQHRRDIAALKRALAEAQRSVRTLQKLVGRARPAAAAVTDGEQLEGVRYSARSVRAQRRRLGISAADYGKLVGVSSLTIYHWEHDKARPRQKQLAGLVGIRGIGKREALARLATMK